MSKCSFGDGITVKPDGIHELDPCVYDVIETHHNVTVEVLRCPKCGETIIQWYRQDGEGCDV